MNYQILYEKRVFKDLDKIPDNDIPKIILTLHKLTCDPIHIATKKLSGHSKLYRIRKGHYRIVYAVSHPDRKIKIISIRHRKDVYRGL